MRSFIALEWVLTEDLNVLFGLCDRNKLLVVPGRIQSWSRLHLDPVEIEISVNRRKIRKMPSF
jgi:hypothetical protein